MSAAPTQAEHLLLRQRVDELETDQGKLLAVAASAERIAKATYEKVALLDGKFNELARDLRKQARRFESFSDLSEAKEKMELMQENKRLRSLPARAAKWTGWGLGVAAVALEIASRLGWLK